MLSRMELTPPLLLFFSLATTLPLLPLISPITALPVSPLPDHDATDMVWEVPITPGGPLVTINGTVQQLFTQLTKLNPNHLAEFPPQTPEMGQPRPDAAEHNKLNKRATGVTGHEQSRHICGKDLYEVPLENAIRVGAEHRLAEYLERHGGQPKLPPSSCARVSCERGQGVWWCNHGAETKVLENFRVIADGYRELKDLCRKEYGKPVGQMVFKDGWSIIYRANNDKC